MSSSDAAILPKIASAYTAYLAEQWAACAAQWIAIAHTTGGIASHHNAFYLAARCYAQDGKPDLAFTALEASIAAKPRAVDRLEADDELATLHNDPRWAKTVAAMTARLAVWENTLKAPQLRRELLALEDEDQAARNAMIEAMQQGHDDQTKVAAVTAIDKKSTQAMKQAIATYGWPGSSLVGDDGEHAAWLLVQHADLEPALQKDALARMEQMLATGEVDATNYAYLYDRVAVGEHRAQRYGTQFKSEDPFPIEDEAHVDARREAVGLFSLAQYKKRMEQMRTGKH